MSEICVYDLKGVTKSYAGRPVLQIERLEIVAGELVCLVGPTGAGKSTLLRMLAGVEAPTSGSGRCWRWELGSRHVALESQRQLTLVFQRPLLVGRSVRANVEYGLRLRDRRHDAARVDQVLDALHLRDLAARPAHTLSGGETQLVALARALVLDPRVLLLDEPTAHLDPARVELVEQAVAAIHRDRQTTVIWATHSLFQTRRVAQRVAFLLDGRLVEIAGVRDFFESPQDPRTRAFVRGDMVY